MTPSATPENYTTLTDVTNENGGSGDCQAAWNYWSRRTEILWDGVQLISARQYPGQHLVDHGSGWVYWDGRTDTALNCERVSV